MQLKRCPFCNSHYLTVDVNSVCGWIRCRGCGACGPHSMQPETLASLWNGECKEAGYTSLVTIPDPPDSNRSDLKDIKLGD